MSDAPDRPARASRPAPLRIQGLRKVFPGGVVAVDDMTLAIEPGELVTVLGPSGCGKTTLLRLLAGFEEPTRGTIHVGHVLMNDLPPHRRGMPMVFQSYALFPHLSVYENAAYGLRVRGVPPRAVREAVRATLELLQLGGLEARSPDQLSGGQQQRVALARCLVLQPKVLLFDEPLSNLDARLRVETRDEIRRLQRRLGITTVYVTHDQAEAMSLADRIVVMRQGRIEQVGTPEAIYRRPATRFVADFVGVANVLDGVVATVSDAIVTVAALGRHVTVARGDRPLAPGDPVRLVVRPEAIGVGEPDSGIPGQIVKTTYLGPIVQYEVDVGGQVLTAADHDPIRPRIRREGEPVGLVFIDHCVHLIPDADAEGRG